MVIDSIVTLSDNMSLSDGNYLNDEQIWSRVEKLEGKQQRVRKLLAQPEVSTDPKKLAKLSKKLNQLNQICSLADRLRTCIKDLREAREISEQESNEEAQGLFDEYRDLCDQISGELYQLLLTKGYIEEEVEDERDIEILEFIQSVGPEYTWNLAINLKMEVVEARNRLEILLEKGLLKRVEGTMLESYHRQEGWDKHMNHTYYKLSRKGKLFLRDLQRTNLQKRS